MIVGNIATGVGQLFLRSSLFILNIDELMGRQIRYWVWRGMSFGSCSLGLVLEELVETELITGVSSSGRGNSIVFSLMVVGFCTMTGVIPEDVALATAGARKIKEETGGGGG